MTKITVEMPLVAKCSVGDCVYNANSNCHARAITIGDPVLPECDTFLAGEHHANPAAQIAGIGACKSAACKFNSDLECVADSVQVGLIRSEPNCMTFTLR